MMMNRRTSVRLGRLALVGCALLLAGCGGKNASSPSDAELAYSASDGQPQSSGIFLVDREGKHHTQLTRRALLPEAQNVSWSPTSDLLLFSSVSGEIWTIRSDGSDPTKIADGDGASWSPDGKLIAVERGDAVDIVSPDGELQKRISLPGEPARSILSTPSWSPDGTRVAFAAGSKGYKNTAPFVAPVRGQGRAVPLVKPRMNEVFQHTPFWSPDGKLLAFESADEFDRWSIWTSRPDGSHRKRVAEDAVSLSGWAPGGRGVLCRGFERQDLGSLHECPLDGRSWRSWRRLAPDEEKRILQEGSPSPDGRQLAEVAHGGAIVVSRAGGSKRRVLTDAGSYASPQWSPDGERLAFVRYVPGTSEFDLASVYVIGRDGKGARRLAGGESAVWLRDGSALVVQRQAGIFVVTLEGKARLLAKGWGVDFDFSKAPVLAADTAMVAYLRSGTLYIMGTVGGRERKVVDFPAEVGDLAWSSDGQALLVVWPDRRYPVDYDAATLFEVDLSGSSKVVATAVHLDAGIAVSPNGGRVAFVGNQGLEVVDLASRKRRTLVRARDPDAFVNPQWSDDGSTVAYLAENDRVDGAPYALETVQADGSARTRVSAPSEFVGSFSWRPTEDRD